MDEGRYKAAKKTIPQGKYKETCRAAQSTSDGGAAEGVRHWDEK
jgi:hypothetical protein